MGWICVKKMKIKRGGEYVIVYGGDPVPEAENWPTRRALVRQKFIRWVDRPYPEPPAEKPASKPPVEEPVSKPPVETAVSETPVEMLVPVSVEVVKAVEEPPVSLDASEEAPKTTSGSKKKRKRGK